MDASNDGLSMVGTPDSAQDDSMSVRPCHDTLHCKIHQKGSYQVNSSVFMILCEHRRAISLVNSKVCAQSFPSSVH